MSKEKLQLLADLLAESRPLSASWLQAASPVTAEIIAQAGFDVLLIDLEHAPGDISMTVSQMQAAKGTGAVPFVRVPWNDHVWIKRVLDAGACGLVIPAVSTAEEAEAAAAAARYPPRGIRGIAGSARAAGYGQDAGAYFDAADRHVCVLVQIETPMGVQNLDAILSVDGVDGIFIGPLDLATTHGHLGRADAEEMKPIVAGIEEKTLAAGKLLAGICSDFEEALAKYERGYRIVTLIHDTVTLGRLARAEIAKFREMLGRRRT